MNLKNNNKGISLSLVIGLVTLLMISSVAVNALIIRSLQSARRIEASSRAYLAAEAGMEDALYELAPHLAGYETMNRFTVFQTGNIPWESKWKIESFLNNPSCSANICGKLFADQKLKIYLFEDASPDPALPADPPIAPNTINYPGNPDITTFDVSSNFSIKFTIPNGIIGAADVQLQIDNDGDLSVGGVNEDYEGSAQNANCTENQNDTDCDGQVNEDGEKDPVILWKLTDGGGRSLIPASGCLSDATPGSEICEKDFKNSTLYSATLAEASKGKREGGLPDQSIADFISEVFSDTAPGVNPKAELEFEFLIIAPMEHINADLKRIEIPHIEYEVNAQAGVDIPYPYFTIESDGFYGTYRQSINATVLPKTTIPLFDFTIIQQE